MDAIELLLKRQSTPLLTEPAPNEADLAALLGAGMRVPDHGGLKPWHFHVITGEGLQRLSALYLEAMTIDMASTESSCMDEDAINEKMVKVAKMPFRAPMIIAISTNYAEHSKVPKQEQLVAAGCCVHAMQMATFALGYGSVWRTGNFAYHETVKQGLGLEQGNDIVGFLYIGTSTKVPNIKPTKSYQDSVTFWQ